MKLVSQFAKSFSRKAREKRATVFRDSFCLDEYTKILDLGSEDGVNIHAVLQGVNINPKHIYIADIDKDAITRGGKRYGYQPVLIGESEQLPFSDGFFDIVYCSSVIEHVTVPKEKIWEMFSGKEFRCSSKQRQKEFATEIQRIGKQYFVQTPYKHFPIESHSWLPFIAWLPRWLLIPVLRITNLFWIKKTSPDWSLLNDRDMSELFVDSSIVKEKVWGLTKSIMAVCSNQVPPRT